MIGKILFSREHHQSVENKMFSHWLFRRYQPNRVKVPLSASISTSIPRGKLMVGRVCPQAKFLKIGISCGKSSVKTSSSERALSSSSELQFVHQPNNRPAHSRNFPAFYRNLSWKNALTSSILVI